MITKQTMSIRIDEKNNAGSLFHLPRFYVEYRLKWQQHLYDIVKFLKTQNDGIGAYDRIQEIIGADGYLYLKKFFKHPLVKQVVNLHLNLPISVLKPGMCTLCIFQMVILFDIFSWGRGGPCDPSYLVDGI